MRSQDRRLSAHDAPADVRVERAPEMDAGRRRILTLCLLAWSLATGFLRLGSAPVYINNEAREGVYVRAMLDTGNWVLPQVPNHVENGETIPDKPPLLHWIAASVAYARTAIETMSVPSGREVSRRFDAWSLRCPSVLCGVWMVMSVAILGRRLLGDRAALIAAASLVMSLQYVQQSQYGRVDMPMAAFVTVSILLLGEALLDGSKRALLAAAVASGLGVLGKGPIGLALPVLVGATWVLVESHRRRSFRWAFDLPWLSAVLVWTAVALPWYLAAYAGGGMAFVRSQLLNENLNQFLGRNGSMPSLYYVSDWLRYSLPWNIFGLLGVVLAWRLRRWRVLYCATWWLVLLVFFQVSAYKRGAYLLPVLPAGAMLCGFFLDVTLPHDFARLRELAAGLRWVPALLLGIVAIALGAYRVLPGAAGRIGVEPGAVDVSLFAAGALVAVTSLALMIRAIRARQAWTALAFLWLCEAGLLHGVLGSGSIVLARRDSPQPLLAHLLADLPEGEIVTVRGLGDDDSLPLLFYFPDPSRIVVVPSRQLRPAAFAPGYYLFSRDKWDAIESGCCDSTGSWRVLWGDDLRTRNGQTPVVFVQRRT
jgi:4-amino-4-deoxy-L-arabinose transferase-like glycosyltransferase